jgi:acetoin utilization deacetylase AcuC-like enzyme
MTDSDLKDLVNTFNDLKVEDKSDIVKEDKDKNIKQDIKQDIKQNMNQDSKLIDKLLKSIKSKPKINIVGFIDDPSCDKHELIMPDHQESPNRTKIIRNAMVKYGLQDLIVMSGSLSVREANLTTTHNKKYFDTIMDCARKNIPIEVPSPSYEISMKDINSLESIMAAVGSVMGAVDTVCGKYTVANEKKNRYTTDRIRKVFCNVRPPGHHAHIDKGSGFCFFNNVAIGANFALQKYKKNIKKVLIFDWDLHHGDGTEDIFKTNPNVMYVSFHRGGTSRKDMFYPGTGLEHKNKLGNIINFPIASNETIESYMDKFNNEFLPLAQNFKPDLVMISAGFDSHKDDLYHQLPLDYIHFHLMTKSLMKLADTYSEGRLVSVLEGGYTLEVLYKSVIVHVATMIDGYD